MAPTIDSAEYWQSLTISTGDLDRIEEIFLDTGVPQNLADLTEVVIEGRLQAEAERRAREANENVRLYQPKLTYQVGQRLRFPALGNSVGSVVALRPGENPDLGAFQVIRVKLDRGGEREFAAHYTADHPLNIDPRPESTPSSQAASETVRHILAERLGESPEYVSFDDLWFRKDLMPNVHIGHLNIAEALIDVAGDAQPTATLVKDVELSQGEPEARTFALNYALAHDPDDRFVNVGTPSAPRWALRQGVTA